MRSIFWTAALVLGFAFPIQAQLEDKVADRLYESSKILDGVVQASRWRYPSRPIAARAMCGSRSGREESRYRRRWQVWPRRRFRAEEAIATGPGGRHR